MKRCFLPLVLLLACGCTNEIKNETINVVPKNPEPVVEEEPKEPEYVDENPVKISLYVDSNSGLDKSPLEFKTTWIKKKDITVFGSIFSEDDKFGNDYYQNIWKNAAGKYDDYTKYKTGWQLEFSLADGTNIDQMIFKPSDVSYFYDYLEIYLYDSANVPIGVWYSHMLDEEMTDETVLTSMKLTAGSKYEEISSPIKVTVFTYDSDDDFDKDGHYRGNSSYSVLVINENS